MMLFEVLVLCKITYVQNQIITYFNEGLVLVLCKITYVQNASVIKDMGLTVLALYKIK